MMRAALLLAVLAACSKGSTNGRTKVDAEAATFDVKRLAFEAYPQWAAAHPDKACPAKLEELLEYVDRNTTAQDPWRHPYKLMCGTSLPAGAMGLAILSFGPDGQEGTADDIKSWQK